MKTILVMALALVLIGGVIVSAALILWLWLRQSKTKLDWLLRLSVTGLYVLWVVLVLPWSMTSLHLRWGLLAALIAATLVSFRRARRAPLYLRQSVWWWLSFGGRILLILLLSLRVGPALQARTYDGEALTIAAPLRGGRYVVDHGGSNTRLNYHSAIKPQAYALDISQVDALGIRKRGVLPLNLERYAIFGDTVYSPVSGTVVTAVDGLPDQTPPEKDSLNRAGNHVWIRTGDVYIVLAHLKRGSVKVRSGETVKAGDPIGEVGNSGQTTEPHLHIHAVRLQDEVSPEELLDSGDPVPLLFDGRFLVRNSTF